MPALKAEEPGQEETVQDGGEVVYEKEHDDGVSCAVFIECVCVHGRCSADHAVSHSPSDLSELLKVGTVEAHDKAENTQFVKDFLKGHIRKELFKEEMDGNRDRPQFAPLYFPEELHRQEALAKDLEFFYGENWQAVVQLSEATRKYVDRIHEVGRSEPELLVAHAYTRYMGDLSGGQVLKKVAQRALKLPSTGEGVQFYTFDNISSAKEFKQLYRSRMNDLDLDQETKLRIVEEANRAFGFNMEIFNELERVGKTIKDEVLDGGLPEYDGKGDLSKCPYYAAKTAAGSGSACVCHMAMAVLSHPTGQVIMSACIALLAGVAAWYLM
ncbi:UNVERIFIED_CONTAM: hypothetical protein FKN15_064903 [Acipenser sinensis]